MVQIQQSYPLDKEWGRVYTYDSRKTFCGERTMKSFSRVLAVSVWVLAAVVLLSTASPIFAFDPLFYARIDYGAGKLPVSVFAADLDGDGDADLAVANYYSDNVSIRKNNGDGTFQTAVNYMSGGRPLQGAVRRLCLTTARL
jgi:hypothetical protein